MALPQAIRPRLQDFRRLEIGGNNDESVNRTVGGLKSRAFTRYHAAVYLHTQQRHRALILTLLGQEYYDELYELGAGAAKYEPE